MSGSGPSTNDSSSKYTKPLRQEYESQQHNNSDAQFKKTHQVVGKPGLTDHNVMDDMIKSPPKNIPGDPAGDGIVGDGSSNETEQPNTVEAKPVEEIRARIGDNANI